MLRSTFAEMFHYYIMTYLNFFFLAVDELAAILDLRLSLINGAEIGHNLH